MPNYEKYREMLVSYRVAFEYDTGAKVASYVSECQPAHGPVQLIKLSRAQVIDGSEGVMEEYDTLAGRHGGI